ncbi:hypothetical protein G9A89_021503 [Geosiphon pyriformis]|nr:hypothetical protein G9A89_021503 [Geosiphon pyriformis]
MHKNYELLTKRLLATTLRKKLTELQFRKTTEKITWEFLYTQQQFPIIYADKDKERLQTPAVTPKKIQPPTWKKTKVESPTYPLYYYTPESAINISLADPPIVPILKPILLQPLQQPIQPSLQQPQQPLQQPQLQQLNLDPMVYTPIAKLEKFTGEKDNAQIWLNNIEKTITANE